MNEPGEDPSLLQRYADWGFIPEAGGAEGEAGDREDRYSSFPSDDDHHQVVLAPIHEHHSSADVPPKATTLGLPGGGGGGGGPDMNDFSLMDFVKRLRKENEQILQEYKHELREQLVSTLKDEAGGILKSFATAMLDSRRAMAGDDEGREATTSRQPQQAYKGKRQGSRKAASTPAVAVPEAMLQHRVALDILQSMTATLGHEHVAKALAARPSRRNLSSAPASSATGLSSSSRVGSAAGGPRKAPLVGKAVPQEQRVTNYLTASPFYAPEAAGVANTASRRPMTTPANASTRQEGLDERQGRGQAEGSHLDDQMGEEVEQELTQRLLRGRAAELLSRSEALLGDATVSMARAATATGGSRRGLLPTVPEAGVRKRPGTALDITESGWQQRRDQQQQQQQRLSTAPAITSPVRSVAHPPAGAMEVTPCLPSVKEAVAPAGGNGEHVQVPRGEEEGRQAFDREAMSRPRPSTTMATGRPSSRHPTTSSSLRATTTIRRSGEVLPEKLGDEEWENEVARNILTLYVSSVKDQSQSAPMGMGSTQMIKNDGAKNLITASSDTSDAVNMSLAYGSAHKKKKRRPSTTPANLHARGASHQQQQRYAVKPGQRHGTRGAVDSSQPPQTAGSGTTRPPSHQHIPRTIPSLGHYRIPVQRRNGSESFVMIPRIPQTIWFAGTGTNRADWSSVPGASAAWLAQLQALDGKGAYAKYLVLTEALLVTALRTCETFLVPPHLRLLWRQLVVTANNFAVRAIETARYALALDLLHKAAELCDSHQQGGGGAILLKRTRRELHAFLLDSYGFYYYRRHKFNAALCYVQRSMRIHAAHRNWSHVAACHLHSSCVLAKMEGRVPEGLRCMSQVLAMVEDGKLDVGGPTTQKVALVAVCYHNMASLYLSLRNLGEAFMCSQNARRLSRLSLAYSNRWSDQFERTHKIVLSEMLAKYKYVDKLFRDKDQEYLFGALLTAM